MRRTARRLGVTVAGVALLVVGLALMVLPGPGLLLVVLGLAVLATEYAWARGLLHRARVQADRAQRAAVANPLRTAGSLLFAVGTVAVGVTTYVVRDVPWPVLDRLLDRLWTPVTGTVLVLTGLLLLGTTVHAVREGHRARRKDYAPDPASGRAGR